ncbi:Fic family protein [Geobacter pickeringii]|uniref:Cell division protein Fic n=1 Tax=Geobacter pickeringii TaxID=345632 RepID=A0A0B5BAQ9_9BACT|nr:Fic family protein [Geobacter pickeringii]AJE02044.1 cell division protein Fic [Geobacter pickeringii]
MTHYVWQSQSWPDFRWNAEELLAPLGECRRLQGRLLNAIAALGVSLGTEAQAEILAEETMTTAAIEGEQFDLKAVRSSVARRLGIPAAGLPVDRHVDGLVAVLMDATQNCDEPLTVERLQGWQASLFPTGYSGLHRIRVGQWRGEEPMRVVSGPVGRETVHFEAPPAERIEEEMARFLMWWDESLGKMEGLLRAAMAHFRFVTIHPFEDGNGRIARALTDMALTQDDRQRMRSYSLSSQIMAEREAYYDVLERCQKGDGDITPWLLWFLGALARAITRSETLLAVVLDKAAFWRLHGHLPLTERQRKVVNRLLDAGKGGFEGGLTTRKYASIAAVSRATAFREMSQLVEWGVIRQAAGKGRSVSYEIVWP